MALKGFGAPGALQKGEGCGTCSPIPLRCISNAGRLQFHTGAGIRFLSRQVFKGIGSEENSRYVVVCATPKSESPSEALDRRLRESKRVEERVIKIHATEDFEEEVEKAGSNLVVLEVNSDLVCESGLDEEPELHWRRDRKEHEKELWEKCKAVKHVFQRTARECPDIRFLSLTVDTLDSSKLCDKLNISVLPTLQFYKKGRLLWEHKGALHMQQDLGEGVLFYGNTAAGGEKATQHVQELHSREDLEKFLGDTQQNNTLAVIDISVTSASPCVRMFPAVVALAKNFQGYAAFARLLGDESPETEDIMRKLGIIDVPTYLFFRNGKLVDKHVGSSRADLIGHILELQSIQGIPPPPPGGNESKQQMRKKEVSNV